MKMATWNVRGYNQAKQKAVLSLVRYSNLVCLTESWSPIPPHSNYTVVNIMCPDSRVQARRRGGVAIIHQGTLPLRLLGTYSEDNFQLIHCTLDGVPVVGAYIAPCTLQPDLDRPLAIAAKWLRGPGVLVGDLNARHTQWDDFANRQGRQLYKWARTHNFLTQRPPAPTCVSYKKGSSRVDLVLKHHHVPPCVQVLNDIKGSVRKPVTAQLATAATQAPRTIPLALINNRSTREKVKAEYEQTLPAIITDIRNAITVVSLERNSRRLLHATAELWMRLRKPRPARFRPGWTQSLDNKAKLRSRLLKSADLGDRQRARQLDVDIKRTFRANLRRLQNRIADEMEGGDPSNDNTLLKRALDLAATKDVAPTRVDPDEYTEYFRSLQPARESAPLVRVQTFDLPDAFRTSLILAIRSKLKRRKTPGPDQLRTEVFQLAPDLFADAGLELWLATGRLAHNPTMLRCGLLSPIYKQKGEEAPPVNNGSVCLTSAFRRLISTALTHDLKQHYR